MILLQLGGASYEIPLVWVVSIGGVLALAVGVLVRVQTETRQGPRRAPFQPAVDWFRDGVMGSAPSPDVDIEATTTTPSPSDGSNFQIATTRLAQGRYPRAIQTAYCHTRTQLAERFGIETSGTHRDFYEQCMVLDDVNTEGLEELTELYERVMFSPASIERADAEHALEITVELTALGSPTAD